MIAYNSVTKKYTRKNLTTIALSNVSFTINKNSIVVLLGPSGCGKTTLLRLTNKLIKLTSGSIYINNININEYKDVELRQNIGYVIQQTGLFPNKTVAENIGIIPKVKKWKKIKIKNRVEELLDLVNLEPKKFYNKYPSELSGGQAQRIGFARALAVDPEIILMDEPFGSIDPINRLQIQDELLKLQSNIKKTILFVTHDVSEALKMGDKIVIFKKGELLQYATPLEILINPANDYVESFIGTDRALKILGLIKAYNIAEKNIDNIINIDTPGDHLINIFNNTKDDFLFVLSDKKPIGYIPKRIIDDENKHIKNLIIPFPFIIEEHHSLNDVMAYMLRYENYHFPVINSNGAFIGSISYKNIKKYISQIYKNNV
jgi:osmoprotectant transport system ATP-binding protein